MESELFPFVVAVLYLVFAAVAVTTLRRALSDRRRRRHLDRHGVPARARVVRVEPMDRSLNGGAGHPVLVEIHGCEGHRWQHRVTDGLGGFVVAEGAWLSVRHSPEDPELLRVEEVNGPHGPFPVCPERGRWNAVAPFVLPVCVIAVMVMIPLVILAGNANPTVFLVVPLAIPVVGAVLLTVSLVRGAGERRRRRRSVETTGTVTDQWEQRVSTGGRGNTRVVIVCTVRFALPDGREVHTRSPRSPHWGQLSVGQPVRVNYSPDFPPRFQLAELDTKRAAEFVVPAVVGLMMLLIGGIVSAGILASALLSGPPT
ncbi:uncharacterized protein DUF3592 [Haloactinospora alba]|uniref:Uncharacterized protein DUF3592 n=1 Tax=Haloactinospora alba TaxID=405555 RepID=A0A543NN14_9ACTN|nr:DUF3592 domain-containing protein [Haloactinospora alba]TQN33216.1 uncharacterized protein DUF3592 [Haloactinospora alba]